MAPEFELDHIFICVSPGAPERDCLAAFGLTEGPPHTYPEQGAACARFFFHNAYLELLWIYGAEAQTGRVRPTHFSERWMRRRSGACPFGLVFQDNYSDCWPMPRDYLPDLRFEAGENHEIILAKPVLFYRPLAEGLDSYIRNKRPPLEHRAGLREVTHVELILPSAETSSLELEAVADLVQLRDGPEYLLVLGFDGEFQGREADFRPRLPLIFRW